MRGYLAALAAFLIWGISSSVLLRSIPYPGPVVTGLGYVFAFIVLAAFVVPKRRKEILEGFRRHKVRLILIAAAFSGCSLTFHWAIKTTTVANAVLVHCLQPLLTCLVFAPIFLKERPDRRALVALSVGIAGMAVLLWPELRWDGSWQGIVLALLSAAFFAWFNVQFPGLSKDLPHLVIIFFCVAIGSVFVVPFAFSFGPQAWTAGSLLKIGIFGLINFVLGNLLFLHALDRAPVQHVGTLAYFEPVVAIGAAAIWLDEPLSAHAILGGLLILASGAIVVFGKRKTDG